MNKAKKAAIAALVASMVLGTGAAVLTGCGSCSKKDKIHDSIVNGGFETGDLTGWKAEGDYAFDVDGVTDSASPEGTGITVAGKVGSYYFNGLAATNATSTGTLTSEPFKLGGTGKIGFKIGAGSDKEKCYVEFIEYGTDTVLAKTSNEAYDAGFIDDDLVRVVVDLSEHIGKNIYIKVTDNGSTANSREYLHLDDFVVYGNESEVTAANSERAAYIRVNGKPVFENDTPEAKTVKNGNFEDGLNNWQIVSGDAYTPKSISPSTSKFWDTREHNAEGNYFLNGYATGEDRVGAIRSTTFTLAGTGIISFLLGNAGVGTIYVAVCADETIGDIEADTELFKVYANEKFSDPNFTLNLIRRYVDASVYTPDGGEEISLIGKKLYIKLVDDAGGGPFGAVSFDDVRCSMTEQEVLDLSVQDYLWAQNLTGRGADEIKATKNYYNEMDYPFGLPLLRFTQTPAGKALKVSEDEINVESYIDVLKAAYAHAEEDEFEYEIVKIEYDGREITENFESVVFDKVGLATVTYKATYKTDAAVEPVTGTFVIDVTNENMIQNGGFETGDLTGWTVTGGENDINKADAVSGAEYGFTSAPYNQGGKYHFDGASAAEESKTYALKSSDFVLGGSGVISFKLGGRAATLRVYDKTSGALLAEYKNTLWNDNDNPHAENGCRNLTMTTYYADLHDFIGLTLYIEISDTESSNWGVAHFDDIVTYYDGDTETVLATLAGNTDAVHYSCSWDDNGANKTHSGDTSIAWAEATNQIVPEIVQITQKADGYIELIGAQTGHDLTQYVTDVQGAVIGVENPGLSVKVTELYDGVTRVTENLNSVNLEAGKTYTVTYKVVYNDGTQDYTAEAEFTVKVISQYEIQNGGFETGDLTGWTYASDDGEIDVSKVIRKEDTSWNERIPLNKNGNYMFNGMGDYIPESWKYHLTSTNFILGGSGYISFKMGGNAAVVKVFKSDGKQIAEYSNTEFADVSFPHVEQGGRWATMTTFVADLREYIGEELYIELHDTKTEGWGIATFDDIVTYYETAPVVEDMYDDVTVYCEDPAGTNYEMPWVLAENEYAAPEAPEEAGE